VAKWVGRERQIQPRLGTRKLHVMIKERLAEAGVKLGRDRLFEVLREHEMLLERRPAQYPRTTNSYHCLPVLAITARKMRWPSG
jgi:putative transposase